uniref:Hcy-binding domain-containing protein n=1 Tax=Pinguiococcus pyrenoidosus TaxID=172671 RepID=A0A7R9UCK1_9STRA
MGESLADHLWSARLLVHEAGRRRIQDVHKAYAEAGANILTSAAYQASYAGFSQAGLRDEQIDDLLLASTSMCREVAGDCLVAASVGPYGAALADGSEYTGAYDRDADGLREWHLRRLRKLVASRPDFLALETIPSAEEVRGLLEALQVIRAEGDAPLPPAWLSMSVKDADGGVVLASGERLDEVVHFVCAQDLASAGRGRLIEILGVNCCKPALATRAIRIVRQAMAHAAAGQTSEQQERRIIVYSNRGEDWDPHSKSWVGTGPEEASDLEYAAEAKRWIDAGASIIGGCCRTTPDTIGQLSSTLTNQGGSLP